jgi:hypothetical protein
VHPDASGPVKVFTSDRISANTPVASPRASASEHRHTSSGAAEIFTATATFAGLIERRSGRADSRVG